MRDGSQAARLARFAPKKRFDECMEHGIVYRGRLANAVLTRQQVQY